MTVYIDTFGANFHGMKMNHMIADTIDELHTFADKLGLKREWFQPKSIPHYDVCESKSIHALQLGAIQVEPGELVLIYRKNERQRKEAEGK